ncbi:MAG: hypothetical protein ABIJ56_13000 [Pseudomonadota bacterium]
MSIKRQKQYSTGARKSDAKEKKRKSPKENIPLKNWEEMVKGQGDEAFLPYAMTTRFEKDAFVLHQTFGKGLVMADERTRIVVLFETGTKKLMHGMEPPGPEPDPDPELEDEPEGEPEPEQEPDSEPEPEPPAG